MYNHETELENVLILKEITEPLFCLSVVLTGAD